MSWKNILKMNETARKQFTEALDRLVDLIHQDPRMRHKREIESLDYNLDTIIHFAVYELKNAAKLRQKMGRLSPEMKEAADAVARFLGNTQYGANHLRNSGY
tara:strand:- start:902 stop:1207 length:306 start_codon:yes stop_codon:yes gene_type:complete